MNSMLFSRVYICDSRKLLNHRQNFSKFYWWNRLLAILEFPKIIFKKIFEKIHPFLKKCRKFVWIPSPNHSLFPKRSFSSHLKQLNIMGSLLYIIAVILVIMWLIGFVGYGAGGIIHILLVIAIIAILFRVISGRRAL